MELVYFALIGIGVYFLSDWLLDRVEASRGARFEHREIVFFAIMLVLALIAFRLVRYFGQG